MFTIRLRHKPADGPPDGGGQVDPFWRRWALSGLLGLEPAPDVRIVRSGLVEANVTRRRDPFQLALITLRNLARSGAFAPGSPIIIAEEARRLRLSPTPVREALAYLCGEGLIERAPSGGYLASRLDVALVRDRFAFRLHCLMIALDLTTDVSGRHRLGGEPTADVRERMAQLVRAAGNIVLADAFERVGCQLHVLVEPERRVLSGTEDEAADIIQAFDAMQLEILRERLTAFHRRRIDAAGALVLETEGGRTGLDQRSD